MGGGVESHLAAEGMEYESGENGIYSEMPSLGSVTCFYNEEDIVEESLEKLERAASASESYETVYAVDDGSEDNTTKIIEEYASDSEVVEFLEMEENTGKFGAQKFATDQMEEDYWLSIDADSYIKNPEDIDSVLREFDDSASAAAMLRLKPETSGEGLLSKTYEKLQGIEYLMRRGVDSITSNAEKSRIITASGTSTLAETEKVSEAMEHHSGRYAGDDRELTSILQLKMGEEIEYESGLEITTDAPDRPFSHLSQRRTWARGQINAVSEHPVDHAKALAKPSRYSAALTMDLSGTVTAPLMMRGISEMAASGDAETMGIGYGAGLALVGLAYGNSALRGERFESDTKKGKAKEMLRDAPGIAFMPIYRSSTAAYSIPAAFKDKFIDESFKEFREGYREAVEDYEVMEESRERIEATHKQDDDTLSVRDRFIPAD